MTRIRKLSVVIPVTIAAPALRELHDEIVARLEALGLEHELLYLVATGDPTTLETVERLAADGKGDPRVLRFAETVGEAPMLSAAAEEIDGDLLLTLPPRFEVDLDVLPSLIAAVREGADVVVAARRRRPSGNSARRQSELFNRVISSVAGVRFRDLASSTRLLRPSVLQEIPLYGEFHRYLPLLAQRAGFRVREIEAGQDARSAPPIVHRPVLYLWRAIDVLAVLFISRFTRHPLRLFGGAGALFAFLGLVLLAVIGVQRLAGTPLGDRPILVLATLLVGLGVQAFTIGLLGELILFFHARQVRDYRVAAEYGAGALGARGEPTPPHDPPAAP